MLHEKLSCFIFIICKGEALQENLAILRPQNDESNINLYVCMCVLDVPITAMFFGRARSDMYVREPIS